LSAAIPSPLSNNRGFGGSALVCAGLEAGARRHAKATNACEPVNNNEKRREMSGFTRIPDVELDDLVSAQ
jgi:hypothetical protein